MTERKQSEMSLSIKLTRVTPTPDGRCGRFLPRLTEVEWREESGLLLGRRGRSSSAALTVKTRLWVQRLTTQTVLLSRRMAKNWCSLLQQISAMWSTLKQKQEPMYSILPSNTMISPFSRIIARKSSSPPRPSTILNTLDFSTTLFSLVLSLSRDLSTFTDFRLLNFFSSFWVREQGKMVLPAQTQNSSPSPTKILDSLEISPQAWQRKTRSMWKVERMAMLPLAQRRRSSWSWWMRARSRTGDWQTRVWYLRALVQRSQRQAQPEEQLRKRLVCLALMRTCPMLSRQPVSGWLSCAHTLTCSSSPRSAQFSSTSPNCPSSLNSATPNGSTDWYFAEKENSCSNTFSFNCIDSSRWQTEIRLCPSRSRPRAMRKACLFLLRQSSTQVTTSLKDFSKMGSSWMRLSDFLSRSSRTSRLNSEINRNCSQKQTARMPNCLLPIYRGSAPSCRRPLSGERYKAYLGSAGSVSWRVFTSWLKLARTLLRWRLVRFMELSSRWQFLWNLAELSSKLRSFLSGWRQELGSTMCLWKLVRASTKACAIWMLFSREECSKKWKSLCVSSFLSLVTVALAALRRSSDSVIPRRNIILSFDFSLDSSEPRTLLLRLFVKKFTGRGGNANEFTRRLPMFTISWIASEASASASPSASASTFTELCSLNALSFSSSFCRWCVYVKTRELTSA